MQPKLVSGWRAWSRDFQEQARHPPSVPYNAMRETTIAYYRLPEMARELVRTTSLLERANRELRRKFRQACCFSSREARTGGYLLAGPALQCRLRQAVLGTHCPYALFRFCQARSLEIDTLPLSLLRSLPSQQ